MRLMEYPDLTPVAFAERGEGPATTWFRAAAVIGGGSLALWGLIVYAVWQLI